MSQIFDEVSKLYDPFLKAITFGGIDRWQKALIEFLDKEGNRLDVGTGTGEVLKKSTNRGLKVGIDLSMGMLKKAKDKCPYCYFLLADAENMPFKELSFRTITLSLVFRHIEDKRAFLKEAYRVLEEGGQIGILDINKFAGTKLLSFLMRYPLKPLGLLLFGRERWDFFLHSLENSLSTLEVKRYLEGEGFRVSRLNRYMLGIVYVLRADKT
ncbi:class I SAM-dependent methyltransferase [Hydrogenobacter hydrogenophilus]|uniref:Demethylmenaquinone methyltransferase / 2-methoxy-6-polyprenyl-1,4-benzoquinol methylase n=1 Tax=Hydrogenobacter hydrogenophilus TaxID=35835 RepID=A0A285NS58_9AQUI|nr:class I SAM-dependent methyltransferase [Hydrogenobacter hydrogenophilus]SNZ12018.1 demethylmenaquinone methyltransferase / 2-methoxy-6-polyprenyl-1,4-benzoquinol methylase [Hydrogenobacter hydrogenophilus]